MSLNSLDAYHIHCITCERLVAVRTAQDISRIIFDEIRRSTRDSWQPYVIAGDGFNELHGDNLILCICRSCEIKRSDKYNIPMSLEYAPEELDARLANASLGKRTIQSFPSFDRCGRRLGISDEARPVLDIEFLAHIIQYGSRNTTFEVRAVLQTVGIGRDVNLRDVTGTQGAQDFFPGS